MQYKKSGFTLVEIMIVIAVISILTAMTAIAVGKVTAGANKQETEAELLRLHIALKTYFNKFGPVEFRDEGADWQNPITDPACDGMFTEALREQDGFGGFYPRKTGGLIYNINSFDINYSTDPYGVVNLLEASGLYSPNKAHVTEAYNLCDDTNPNDRLDVALLTDGFLQPYEVITSPVLPVPVDKTDAATIPDDYDNLYAINGQNIFIYSIGPDGKSWSSSFGYTLAEKMEYDDDNIYVKK